MIHIFNSERTAGYRYFLGPVNIAKQWSLLFEQQHKVQKVIVHAQVKIHVRDLL